MAVRLPSAQEINVFDSLDERWAAKNFLGKDLKQAEELFGDNFLHYGEDLLHMGPIAFRFYVPAAINYLRSEKANHDACAADWFCRIVELRLDQEPNEIASVAPILREAILGILNRFDRYECDEMFHGDVAERYRALLKRLDV